MAITYHKDLIHKGSHLSTFPHSCLRKDIQEYIDNKHLHQDEYLVSSNEYYLFIWLVYGGRIDVSID